MCARRVQKNVQHGVVEGAIYRMPMRFPVPIGEVELNAAALHLAIDANRGVLEIRTSFPVPRAELHDLNLTSADGPKPPAEIARKPAGLQLQFVRISRRGEECTLLDAAALPQLCVAVSGGHPEQRRR
jgi:hypothetical protein